MEQLTVRGFGRELSAVIRRLAAKEQVSLNQAALKLLRRGAGLSDGAGQSDTVGSSLDHLIGSWSQAEAEELDGVLKDFKGIDKAAWE